MSKKIAVIGTGYVGLTASIGLADFGNDIIGVDIDQDKVKKLNSGISPIYEPGSEEYLRRNMKAGRLRFSTDVDWAMQESEVIVIAVGTPPKDDGEADLSDIKSVVESISNNMNGYKVIVTKSTVPVGTNRWIKEQIQAKTADNNFDVIANPEFLREGRATYDFFHPDKVVVGYESERARKIIEDIYRALNLIQVPFVWCNLETAELVKYANNAFLATKITFVNQLANLAETVGADINVIAKSMGMDGRISSKFLHPGPGYGGSCLPKDARAVVHMGDANAVDMSLMKSVVAANEMQKQRMVKKLKRMLGDLNGKNVAVLGLAFKVETDDVRESPSVTIVEELIKEGVTVRAHDPKAIENFRQMFGQIEYYEDEFDAVDGADALMICTDWNVYRNLDLDRVRDCMRGKVILDTRDVLDRSVAEEKGFVYEGVGR